MRNARPQAGICLILKCRPERRRYTNRPRLCSEAHSVGLPHFSCYNAAPKVAVTRRRLNMPYNKMVASIALMALLAMGGCSQSGPTPDSAANQTGNQSAANAPANEPARAAAPRPKPIVVPEGTSIAVTVDQAVSSKTNDA